MKKARFTELQLMGVLRHAVQVAGEVGRHGRQYGK